MKKAKLVKSICLVALCGVLVVGCFGIAAAEVVVHKSDKATVAIYGQINRAVLYANDGDSDNFYHVDNDNSSSRIGAKITAKPNDKLTVGAQVEYEYQSNASDLVWQNESNTKDEKFADRIIEVFVECMYGKLTLGQGSTASDGTSEVDLSGTNVVGYSDVKAFAGGVRFFDDGTNALSGTKISNAFNNMDGLSRADRIRYDTPSFNGFQLSASAVSEDDDDAEDFALRYKGDIAGIKTAGAVSYVNYSSSNSIKNQVSGSLSLLAKNGLNLTLAAGNRRHEASGRDEAAFYYAKLGYIAKLFSFGTTAFAVDYGTYNDVNKNGDEADTIGLLAVQELKAWNTEIYCGYRRYELDRTVVDYDSIDAAMAGVGIKF